MNSRQPFKRLIERIMFDGLESFGRHYSCYRGFVGSNNDPRNMDRLFVIVPHISGNKREGNWAWPKGKPYTQRELPKPGDMVWVEFERGDFKFPVWSYSNQTRDLHDTEEPHDPEKITHFSERGHYFEMDDRKDSISVHHKNGSYVEVFEDKTEIIDSSGSSIILQDGNVIINGGENGGLIKIEELISKINRLENAMNNHQHISAAVGSPTTPLPVKPITSNTQKADLENNKVKH